MIRWHGSLLLDKIDDKTFLQLQDVCLLALLVQSTWNGEELRHFI